MIKKLAEDSDRSGAYTLLVGATCALAAVFFLCSCDVRDESLERPPGRDPVFEQEIYARLATLNPDAAAFFRLATEAADNGDPEGAKHGYERVLQLVPDFPDALRRLGYLELALGDTGGALDLMRRACAVGESPHNRVALAAVLLATEITDNEKEALALAWDAVEALPDDDRANAVLLHAGSANEDISALRQATGTLLEVAPEYPVAHYSAGILAADDGKWELAERELLLAQDLGVPAEAVQRALDSGITSQARLYRAYRWGLHGIVIWLIASVALFLVGMLLSRLTVIAVERPQPITQSEVRNAERFVRALYRVVIALASVYFYVSIPVLILIVLALTAALSYLCYTMGHLPALLGVLGMGIYTLVAVVRAVFSRIPKSEPGRLLAREEALGLWSVAYEVAERIGTRPVDAIHITPAASVSVTERGSLLRQLSGSGERCLILGAGVLPGMTVAQFKAILAHEYGHFSGRDSAGGKLALRVHLAMQRMAYTFTVKGLVGWYNPAWLFVGLFNRIFLRITLGASRLQEILADRQAAMAFGVQDSIDGLTHAIRQGMAFEANLSHKVDLSTRLDINLPNLYVPVGLPELLQKELNSKLDREMGRSTLTYDSHPSPKERIMLMQQLESMGEVERGMECAWGLLPDAEAIQDEMMTIIRDGVRRTQLARAEPSAQRR